MISKSISLRRVMCLAIVFASAGYLLLHWTQQSEWYRNRLYQRLIEGDPEQRVAAAVALTRVGAQDQLLKGLRSDVPEIRELSRRGVEHLWFTACGAKPLRLLEEALKAQDEGDFLRALEVLDRLVDDHPEFAEGWNQRASVYWQTGEYRKSMADCERALALNPNHYGAWQGLGICHLNLGNLQEACRAMREALKIVPNDPSTLKSLRQCEEILQTFHPERAAGRPELLI